MQNTAFSPLYTGAVEDFRRARRRAVMQQILSRLAGKSVDALSYDELRKLLKVQTQKPRQLKDVPLDAIVGSVGRYHDFTRSFLPKASVDQERWARVKVAATGLVGLPPIELYQIGQTYFVLDGNHRVSVARQLGATHIEAYVTELETQVPLDPQDRLDDLILKVEYLAFLEQTGIDQVQPGADLRLTAPGRYHLLQEHIDTHRYFMGLDHSRDISYPEAVASWYHTVYLPVVQVIREKAILRHFPGRTETDLYLWAAQHRQELRQQLGWEVAPDAAAADLSSQAPSTVRRTVDQIGRALLEIVTPDPLAQREPVSAAMSPDDQLFAEILVPLRGDQAGWQALAQACQVARREGGGLRGLHVVPTDQELESDSALALQAEFDRRCRQADIPGSLVIASGKVSSQICSRSRWTDLAVIKLDHPPPSRVLGRLSSGFRMVLRRCSSPVLAVPGEASPLSHALLAYDGSPKAQEALYIAAYLALRWQLALTLLTTARSAHAAAELQAPAREYLSRHGVQATLLALRGRVVPAILKATQDRPIDLTIMGGYSRPPVTEVTLGSAVGAVLRASRHPVLICQ